MAKKTITALYDRYEDAAAAVSRLEALGISSGDISIVANNEGNRTSSTLTGRTDTDDTHADDGAGTGATAGTLIGGGAGLLAGLGLLAIPGAGPVVAAGWLIATLTGAGIGAAAGGLVGSLVGAGVPEEHAETYAEGIRRGGTLVTVRADDAYVDRAVDILDDHGSVDMEERSRTYRSEGFTTSSSSSSREGMFEGSSVGEGAMATGYNRAGDTVGASAPAFTGMEASDARNTSSTSATTSSSGSTLGNMVAGAAAALTGSDTDRTTARTTASDADRTTTRATGYGATGATSTTTGDKEAIPVVEEELRVGKRQVAEGKVRVHSYVVETPVQEQVTLREENVHVERRPVDRPISDADRLFQDRTIEAETRREEAVVSKEARVKEEIVLDKDVEERTQTVQDTVRRTEVEVEDERGRTVSGTTGTGTDRTGR